MADARLIIKRCFWCATRMYFAMLLIPACTYAQADTGQDSLYRVALNNARDVYSNAIGQQSALYNGPLYYFYNPVTLKGSAFFGENITSLGNVLYDGMAYRNIHLIYDLYKDELITYSYDGYTPFVLIKDNVQSFDLQGHHFVNLNADSTGENTLPGGYYDELYNGRQQVLVKTGVTIKEVTSSMGTPEAFSTFSSPSQSFFLKKGGSYYRITGESSLLKILQDKKKLLKIFIKTNKIKYSKDPGASMARIVSFYDSLEN